MTLRLPSTAFESLDVPMISQQGDIDIDQEHLLAARLLLLAALSFRHLERPLEADALIRQVSTLGALDALVIDLAQAVLSEETWQAVDETVAGFGKDAIPKVYQGRDKRLCGLIIVLRSRTHDESAGDDTSLVQLFKGLDSVCRYDMDNYDRLVGSLVKQGVMSDYVPQVLSHLGEEATE